MALQLDPEAEVHGEADFPEAERRGALPWRCQIVRVEENGELDRMLANYLERWRLRTGRKIPTAVAIRGLLRQALLAAGCRKAGVSRATKRRGKYVQQDLFGQAAQ